MLSYRRLAPRERDFHLPAYDYSNFFEWNVLQQGIIDGTYNRLPQKKKIRMKNVNLVQKLIYITGCAVALTALVSQSFAEGQKPKVKPYPLKTCIVSDEKLGDMGETYVFTHEGREIKMCCKDCRKEFDKDPAKFMKKLDAAEKKAAAAKAAPNSGAAEKK